MIWVRGLNIEMFLPVFGRKEKKYSKTLVYWKKHLKIFNQGCFPKILSYYFSIFSKYNQKCMPWGKTYCLSKCCMWVNRWTIAIFKPKKRLGEDVFFI